MRLVTQALILNRYDVGESDLLLVMLSPTWGRLTALAKGARRSRKRFVNVLEPFTLLRAHLRGGKGGLSPFLDQADLLESWEPLRLDPWRFTLASYFAELIEVFSRPRTGQEVFGLLKEALITLCQEGPSMALKLAFELKLLEHTGFSPELGRCVRCQRQEVRLAGFSLEDGGVVCHICYQEQDLSLSPRGVAVLRSFQRYPLSKLKRIRTMDESFIKGASLIEKFLVRILDYEIKALRVWKEMNERRTLREEPARLAGQQ